MKVNAFVAQASSCIAQSVVPNTNTKEAYGNGQRQRTKTSPKTSDKDESIHICPRQTLVNAIQVKNLQRSRLNSRPKNFILERHWRSRPWIVNLNRTSTNAFAYVAGKRKSGQIQHQITKVLYETERNYPQLEPQEPSEPCIVECGTFQQQPKKHWSER